MKSSKWFHVSLLERKVQNLNKTFILLVLSFFLSGCTGFGIGQDTSTSGSGQFLKGGVVKGFPGVPAYPKARLGESWGDGRSWGVYSVSSDKLDKVLKFYSENLGKTGWENTQRLLSQNRYIYEIKNAKYQGTLIVNTASDMKSTAITASLITRAP